MGGGNWGVMTMVFVVLGCVCACAYGVSLQEESLLQSASFDYGEALGKAILFFEGQRSGKLPAEQRVGWRGDSALNDGKLENVNLTGGFYDAGDNVKFGFPMAFTITLLSWAALDYEGEISSVNQLEHLRSTISWGADFLVRAHTSPTTLYTQIGDGNSDHRCWERPEDMDTPRTLYKITPKSPGTEAAAEAASALSAASAVFKRVDINYSRELLKTARSLFEFADKYRGSYQASCPFYCSYSGYQDELLWAAAWLHRATGDDKYMNYIVSNQGWSQKVTEFSWDNKFAGVQALLAKQYIGGNKNLRKFKGDVESFVCALMPGSSSVQVKTTPGGLLFTRDGSNLQYVTTASMVLLSYAKLLELAQVDGVQCGSDHFTATQIRAFAKSQVDYILGDNPMKMSYMIGFGPKFPQQLHHRGASVPSIRNHRAKIGCNAGYSYYNSPSPNPNVHNGALVGGPNFDDGFRDQRSDYSHSEPSTYMNAAFVGSLAALLGGNEAAVGEFVTS
ncbi:hypothetical protein SAY86_013128 [Trapa natans]|uniref:Endoglucanase n=1 Tax=Trapa natans TaxID=22666 RepID=A0AAN7M0U4_TRANT|nr:hypothetical protein SAY86_013128 [Trapa natans]